MQRDGRLNPPCQMPERYQLIDVLGEGSYGKVWLAEDKLHKRPVALKLIPKDGKLDLKYVKSEIDNQKGHTCPGIVKFIEVIYTDNYICIVMEYAAGGNLKTHMKDQGGVFYEKMARWYFQQIICALKYLHRHDVVMRDVKLENVVLNQKHTVAKLCDYGFSKRISEGPCTFVGTPQYLAPELVIAYRASGSQMIGKYNGKAVDVWTAGVCLYRMIYGRYPFEDPAGNRPGATQRLLTSIERSHIVIPSVQIYNNHPVPVSNGARKLLERIFTKNPSARITVDGIINTDWFQEDLPEGALEDPKESQVPRNMNGVQSATISNPEESPQSASNSRSWIATFKEWIGK